MSEHKDSNGILYTVKDPTSAANLFIAEDGTTYRVTDEAVYVEKPMPSIDFKILHPGDLDGYNLIGKHLDARFYYKEINQPADKGEE